MTLYIVSGYSLGDYISANGWRKAARLVFKDPRLVWQMAGSGLMRRCARSRRVHVLIESGGMVFDRQFRSDSITTPGTVLNRVDVEGYMEIPRQGPQVPLRPGARSSSVLRVTLGYLILFLTRGRCRWCLPEDCITTAKWYLDRAGIRVPQKVWTADGLLACLEEQGYSFVPHRNR